MTTSPECLTAALDYLARGWSVLPLCPHDHVGVGKAHRGCKSPGKRPFFPNRPDAQSGLWADYQTQRATENDVRDWWKYHPGLNVGVALGPVSELVAVDIDDEDGEALLLTMAGEDLPATWEYTTGKGRRLLYRLPQGVEVKSVSFKRPGTEIEILRLMGAGGQVVLPPSIHPNGSVYRWAALKSPSDIPAAEVPEWMRSIKAPAENRAVPADGEMIDEGGRDNYLTSLAGAMRKRGADYDAIHAAIEVTNRNRCNPPLDAADIDRIARSVSRYKPDDFTGVTITVSDNNKFAPSLTGEYTREFKWASELSAPPKAEEWIWKGYLPRAGISLLSALWKSGKTTLLSHLLRALANEGEFLGQPIKSSKVLYVSEEGEQHWVRRRDDLRIGDHAGFYLQPFDNKPDPNNWKRFINRLKADVEKYGFDLIVFDTLAKLWPVTEENDAGQVDATLMTLWELTKAGASVLLIHHLRKSGGQEYTGSRGSGALSAFPDIIIELTRFDAGDNKDRKRVLRAKGRYDETPDELVIELIDGEYRHIPDANQDRTETVVGPDGQILLTVPPASSEEEKVTYVLKNAKTPWLTMDGIREGLTAYGWGMRDADVEKLVKSLVRRLQVVTCGILRSKSKPRRYAHIDRTLSHSRHSAPGSVSGNEIGNEIGSDPETSHSHISFPPLPQGRNDGNEMTDSRITADSIATSELYHVLKAGGPKTAKWLSEHLGLTQAEVRIYLSPLVEGGFVNLNEDEYSIAKEDEPSGD